MNFNINSFIAAAAFLAMISCGQNLNAQITISAENTIEIGSNETITFSASGTDSVSDVTLVAVVDQNTGSGPSIIDVIGLEVFDGAAVSFGPNADPGTSPRAVVANFDVASPQLIDGTDFAAVSFDTSILEVGDFFDIALAFGIQETTFGNADGEVEAIFPDAFRVTVVSAVPEPSSLVLLLATGGLAVLRRRKQA